ncbi:MAG TPA: cell wall-binding repeat-containing protein [Acidimicrobiales bacterium]|nr:cell wall-binding repeat-containing protein [Acidimicrobiales bacterium]
MGSATLAGGLVLATGSAFAAAPTTFTAAASSAPNVYPGATGQPAGNVTLTLSNNFGSGDEVVIPIEPNGAANGSTNPTETAAQAQASAVTYTATPTVTPGAFASGAGAGSTSDTAPAITATLATNPADPAGAQNAGLKDELVLKFTNSATGTAADTYSIALSGIKYDVGSAAGSTGGAVPIDVAPSYEVAGLPPGTPSTPATVQNATLQNTTVTETPTGVVAGSTGDAVNPFAVTESVPGTIGKGTASLAPSAGTFTGSATVTATGFTVAAVPTSGTCPTTGGSSTATVAANGGSYTFCVVSNTTTTPGSLTISGITYSAPASDGPVTVTLTTQNAGNTGTNTYTTTQPGITTVAVSRVAGQTADDTAAQAANSAFPNGATAALLASDAEYQDALAASYLESQPLKTQSTAFFGGGTQTSSRTPLLLNPYDAPNGGESATAAANAIRKLGVNTVYIIGGTSAISADVATQLSQTQIGTAPFTGQPIYLQVIRIAGQTAEQTAAQVAQYSSTTANTLQPTPGAYGLYNSGASESTSGPTTAVPTAIVANSTTFQDALASSGLANNAGLPIVLTPAGQGLDSSAAGALTNLGVKQVLVVGGNLAVSDQAVSDLQKLGISVLRIAGTTFSATAEELALFETQTNTQQASGSTAATQPDGLGSPTTAAANAGQNSPTLTVATSRGDDYADALSSSQVVGYANSTGAGPRTITVVPLLLNADVANIGNGTADFLNRAGTAPGTTTNGGGLKTYPAAAAGATQGAAVVEHVLSDIVFGGTLAQTPTLVQTELNDIAAG